MTDLNIKRLLAEIIIDNQQGKPASVKPRRFQLYPVQNKAQIIIGVRRSGKTSSLHKLKETLISNGVSVQNIVEVNFYDERLHNMSGEQLGLISEAYFEMFPDKKEVEKVYFFFDELQEIEGWELYVERLLRSELSEVYITGSSAKLLSKEIASQMGGRALSYELFPLSFKEFLDFKGVDFSQISSKTRLIIQKEFRAYLDSGGFPEVFNLPVIIRRAILQEYFLAIVNRDLILRHNIRYPRALRDLADRLIASNACLYTTNRLYEFLRSLGHKLSKDFVVDAIGWFEDAYSFFSVYIYDTSLSRRLVNPRKIYSIDVGLVQALSTNIQENQGRLLENLVFLHLRSQQIEAFYYKTKKDQEVDFVYLNEDKELKMIQVAWDLEDEDTKEREVSALMGAMKERGVTKALLVTLEEEGWMEIEDLQIEIIPAWRYLLKN